MPSGGRLLQTLKLDIMQEYNKADNETTCFHSTNIGITFAKHFAPFMTKINRSSEILHQLLLAIHSSGTYRKLGKLGLFHLAVVFLDQIRLEFLKLHLSDIKEEDCLNNFNQ